MRIGLALLLLAGCAGAPPSPEPPRNQPQPSQPPVSNDTRTELDQLEAPFHAPGVVSTGLGGVARLGAVEVRPLAILEDSRCPRDVECVWAGRIRVRVRITGVAGEPAIELDRPVPVPGHGALVLVAVAPAVWQHAPPGVDTSGPPRFAFRLDVAGAPKP